MPREHGFRHLVTGPSPRPGSAVPGAPPGPTDPAPVDAGGSPTTGRQPTTPLTTSPARRSPNASATILAGAAAVALFVLAARRIRSRRSPRS